MLANHINSWADLALLSSCLAADVYHLQSFSFLQPLQKLEQRKKNVTEISVYTQPHLFTRALGVTASLMTLYLVSLEVDCMWHPIFPFPYSGEIQSTGY